MPVRGGRYSRRPAGPAGQRGNMLLVTMLGLFIFSFVMFQIWGFLLEQRQGAFRTGTASLVNEVGQASKAFFMNEVDSAAPACLADRTDCWPEEIDDSTPTVRDLVTSGFMADGADRNGWGLETLIRPVGPTPADPRIAGVIEVETVVPNQEQAISLANYFGGLARIDATVPTRTVVIVSYAAPGVDPEHEALLDRDGTRGMLGGITFDINAIVNEIDMRAGTRAGDIVGVGNLEAERVVVRTPGLTGVVEADTAFFDVVDIDTLRVNN